MKIAILGKWHRYPSYFLHGSLEGAIQNGHQVMGIEFIDLGIDNVKTALTLFSPDLILCHMLFSNEGVNSIGDKLELMKWARKKLGAKVFYQMGDPRIIPRYSGDISEAVDGVLLAHQDWENFGVLNTQLIYWPYGCLYQAGIEQREKRYKMIFAGTYNSTNYLYQDRTRFLRKLEATGVLKLFPDKGEPNTTFITPYLCSVSGAVLNVLGRHDIKFFLSLRPFQFMGAGGLCIQKRLDGINEVFEFEKHYLVFDTYNIDEVLDLYKFYVEEHPELGEKIRRTGFEYCQKNHNYRIRIADLLDVIAGKRQRVRYLLEDF